MVRGFFLDLGHELLAMLPSFPQGWVLGQPLLDIQDDEWITGKATVIHPQQIASGPRCLAAKRRVPQADQIDPLDAIPCVGRGRR